MPYAMRDSSARIYEMNREKKECKGNMPIAEDCFRKQNMPACHPLSMKLSHNNSEKKNEKKRQRKKEWHEW